MKVIENIASDLEQRITYASIGNSYRPTILFCGCDPRLKKDMHKSGKSIGFNPSYSIKHTPLDPCSPKQSYNFVVPFKVKYLLFPFSHLTNVDFL